MILGHFTWFVIVILDESLLVHEADREPPHKIDENMWKNREHMEETLFLLETSNWPAVVKIQIVVMAVFHSSSNVLVLLA